MSKGEVEVGVRVTNEGSKAVTVGALGIELPLPGNVAGMTGVEVTIGQGYDFSPPLPYRLDSHDEMRWSWPADFTLQVIKADSFRPFVDALGWRPPRNLRHIVMGRVSEGSRRYYIGDGEWFSSGLLTAMLNSATTEPPTL